jgi:hypothetical protein
MLQGSLSVHLEGEGERLPAFCDAVASGELPPGYAADDGAALLYAGTRLRECVASHRGARIVHVAPDGSGGVEETELAVRLLPGASEPGPLRSGAYGVAEMRGLRSGRHRWD